MRVRRAVADPGDLVGGIWAPGLVADREREVLVEQDVAVRVRSAQLVDRLVHPVADDQVAIARSLLVADQLLVGVDDRDLADRRRSGSPGRPGPGGGGRSVGGHGQRVGVEAVALDHVALGPAEVHVDDAAIALRGQASRHLAVGAPQLHRPERVLDQLAAVGRLADDDRHLAAAGTSRGPDPGRPRVAGAGGRAVAKLRRSAVEPVGLDPRPRADLRCSAPVRGLAVADPAQPRVGALPALRRALEARVLGQVGRRDRRFLAGGGARCADPERGHAGDDGDRGGVQA